MNEPKCDLWAWAEDIHSDRWEGPYDTRQEAIAAAGAELLWGTTDDVEQAAICPARKVTAGEIVDHMAPSILENMGEEVYAIVGDTCDEWPPDQEKSLAAALRAWIDEHAPIGFFWCDTLRAETVTIKETE